MKRYIETDHAPHMDITFIMEHLESDNGDPLRSSVVGWYYGEPDNESTKAFIGKLIAHYDYDLK